MPTLLVIVKIIAAARSRVVISEHRTTLMLRRKKPKMLRKRRIMDVSAVRRRVKRSLAVMKLHRRQRNYQTINQHQHQSEMLT
jgi:hypothetical protein